MGLLVKYLGPNTVFFYFVTEKKELIKYLFTPISSSMNAITCSSSPAPTPAMKTVRVLIKGRVQGVFFRDWTVSTAKQLGLNGWVRNRRDGSVEAVFSGDTEKVSEMVGRKCWVGPPQAVVKGVEEMKVEEEEEVELSEGFERKSTV